MLSEDAEQYVTDMSWAASHKFLSRMFARTYQRVVKQQCPHFRRTFPR